MQNPASAGFYFARISVKTIKSLQQEYGAAVMPTDTKIEAELFYNKANIF